MKRTEKKGDEGEWERGKRWEKEREMEERECEEMESIIIGLSIIS